MSKIHLNKIDTRSPKDFEKEETKAKTLELIDELDELQNMLYAGAKYNVLIVIQGMDASGKDGLTKDVFGTMNPQGVKVQSYKAPTPLELSHDFLWRIHSQAPARGMIQIFNRSHYEDVLVTRVHGWCNDKLAEQRMEAINDFEQLLQRHNDTIILKFYLHISPEEQQERLAERLQIPRKMWKYNAKDIIEAQLWDKYMGFYEEVFDECDHPEWQIIPADQNWYKCYLVAKALRDALKGLNMEYPGLKK